MSDIVRKVLIESKIEVLEQLKAHINSEISGWRQLLQTEPTPDDEGYTGSQEQA